MQPQLKLLIKLPAVRKHCATPTTEHRLRIQVLKALPLSLSPKRNHPKVLHSLIVYDPCAHEPHIDPFGKGRFILKRLTVAC